MNQSPIHCPETSLTPGELAAIYILKIRGLIEYPRTLSEIEDMIEIKTDPVKLIKQIRLVIDGKDPNRPFEVDEVVTWHSPYTDEDKDYIFRGKTGSFLVLYDKISGWQGQVPENQVRHKD